MHDASPLQDVPPAAAGQARPVPEFVGSEIYRHSSYGAKHPLAIPRVSTCIDLCRALGWLPDAVYHDSPRATPAELARFHDPAYVAAVQAAERTQCASPEMRARFHLGAKGNPVFREVFRRPATAAGGSLLAVRRLMQQHRGTVYNPAGGTHHGRPDRASGFCYFNDPVLALLAFLDAGLTRVAYLDVDAHHADGVQDAFAGDSRVLTVSVHEDGRWPMTGGSDGGALPGSAHDTAGGTARNFPVPPGFHDDELAYVLEAGILPTLEAFEPQALVLQCGSDAGLAPRLLVLGGGGYNPWSVGRAWAGVWATLNGHPIPDRLPPGAEEVLRRLSWRHSRGRNPPESWFITLADPPRRGPVRAEVKARVATALAA
jgi:acetoin utilization protein AcuC